jgi:hypothetical protein
VTCALIIQVAHKELGLAIEQLQSCAAEPNLSTAPAWLCRILDLFVETVTTISTSTFEPAEEEGQQYSTDFVARTEFARATACRLTTLVIESGVKFPTSPAAFAVAASRSTSDDPKSTFCRLDETLFRYTFA